MEFTASQIAQFLGIEECAPGAISFLSDTRYEPYLYKLEGGVVLVNADFQPQQPVKATLLRVADARECLGRLMQMAGQGQQRRVGVHPTAVVEPTAEVAADAYVGPHAYVAAGAKVGARAQLYAGCVVEENATNVLVLPNAISINPLNWKLDETYAPASENLGSLVMDEKTGSTEIRDIGGDAQVNIARGTVITNADAVPNEMTEYTGPQSYHQDDYAIFYNNIKDNVAKRIAAYQANSSETE